MAYELLIHLVIAEYSNSAIKVYINLHLKMKVQIKNKIGKVPLNWTCRDGLTDGKFASQI